MDYEQIRKIVQHQAELEAISQGINFKDLPKAEQYQRLYEMSLKLFIELS